MSSEDEIFRARVKRVRERLAMSQTDLADLVRGAGHPFHQTTIARVEAGERLVRLGEAFAIANALGVDLAELLAFETSVDSGEYNRGYRDGRRAGLSQARDAISRLNSAD